MATPRTAPRLSPAGPRAAAERPWLRVHHTGDPARVLLEPSPPRRLWAGAGALYCTPMIVASQLGWTARNPAAFWATWNGGETPGDLRVDCPGGGASSHFGCGIVTVTLPYYLETSPGLALLVKAVPNLPVDGWWPLEGLVETDWFEGSFTLNFRCTRANTPVYIAAGAPLVQLVPYPQALIEGVGLEWATEAQRTARMAAVEPWNRDRAALLARNDGPDPALWSRDGAYQRGVRHDGAPGAPPPARRLHLAHLRGQPQGEAW
jgi:hypothetical protein